MTATSQASTDSASRWGPAWGARAEDWAEIEDQQRPTYEEAIRRAGIGAGQRVLDVGCGSGAFLSVAAAAGAHPHGLDASDRLLAIARGRLPSADLRQGDMQSLPWDDDYFDVVTGFNSFFFAEDMTAAVREAGRVAKPGAPVVLQVWGRPEFCDLTPMKAALARFLPTPPPGAPKAPALWQPGALEEIASQAGLTPDQAFDTTWAYDYPDDESLGRAMISPGLIAPAIREHGKQAVRAAIVEALAPYRTADGGYRLTNEWHYLIARA